jgi:hypothetical protein
MNSETGDGQPANNSGGRKLECIICKHYGTKTIGHLERAQLFDEMGSPLNVNLCRSHAVELFKAGQRKFLISHYRILEETISSDDTKFLEILEKTILNNKDQIY